VVKRFGMTVICDLADLSEILVPKVASGDVVAGAV
jgi:hypothetical protein